MRCDPRQLSVGELERLTRRYTFEIAPLLGPDRDIPAPDVNTDERVMAWLLDTLGMIHGNLVPEVVTGVPPSFETLFGGAECLPSPKCPNMKVLRAARLGPSGNYR